MNKNTLRSIGAILAGILSVVVLSTGTDVLLETAGVFPPPDQGLFDPWMLLLAFVYRSLYGVGGGYLTTALSPHRSVRDAIILGSLGTAASIVGVIVGWNLSAHWYPIALVITALPLSWMGARMRLRLSQSPL